MRLRLPRLALLALLSPACWSGFAEVHVAAGDASAPGDRPALDRPAEDAPRAPDGAQDATADAVNLDALAVDVVDAGGLEDRFAPDVVDAPAPEDARDAAVGLDAVDAPELRDVVAPEDRIEGGAGDVVDAPAPCGGACMAGEECVAGRCGRWTFAGYASTAGGNYDDATGLSRAESICVARLPGRQARICRVADIETPLLRDICHTSQLASLGDPDRVFVRPDNGRYVPACVLCPPDGGAAFITQGLPCQGISHDLVCCGFVAR